MDSDDAEDDEFFLFMFLFIVQVLQLQLAAMNAVYALLPEPTPYSGAWVHEQLRLATNEQFRSHFRLDRASFDVLVQTISQLPNARVLFAQGSSNSVPISVQCLLAIYRLSNEHIHLRAGSSTVGRSPSFITYCTRRFCLAMQQAFPLRFPTAERELADNARDFQAFRQTRLKCVAAAADGTLIRLGVRPALRWQQDWRDISDAQRKLRSDQYLCRKRFFAMNVLIMIDARKRIIFVRFFQLVPPFTAR
jgi:hypothetical protein